METFWDYFNKVLQTVLEIKSPPNSDELEDLGKVLLRPFTSVDAKEFTLQFLSKFSKLKDYIKVKLDYPPVGPGVFIPVYSNVKEYLNSNPSEKSLRSTIPVIESILNEWPLERESVIVMIWEYMYERINLPFLVPGMKNRRRETEKSCEEFLNEVKNRLHPGLANEDENSFGFFLKLMVNQVRKLRSEGQKVLTLHSRFFLRFENKLDEFLKYSEIALYRVSSLFLTAGLVYDVEKEMQKLRELMNIRKTDILTNSERIVKWRTQGAILLFLVENGLDGSEITDDIKQEIAMALSRRDVKNLTIFVECLTVLVKHRNDHLSATAAICSFLGNWLERYSSLAPASAKSSFLPIFDPLIDDIRGDNCWWDGDEKQNLETNLCSFVLPVLTANVNSQFAKTAASFLSYLIRQKKWKVAYSFYKAWASRDDENCTTFTNFITNFYTLEENIQKLGFVSCQYDQDIVQCFVKHHLLNERTTTSQLLSKAVASLPAIKRYMTASDGSFLNEDQDHLFGFIHMFGKFLYRAGPSEKANLEGLFYSYFQNFGEYVMKPLMERKSEFVIKTIYRCSANLTSECYSAIYSDSRPSILKDIVDNVFLPMKWYTHYKFMPTVIKEAASAYLPVFIRGLLKINKKYDYVKRTVADLLEYYFQEECDSGHPFVECLLDGELTIPFSSELANKFLFCSSSDSKPEKCLRLLSSVSNNFTKQVIFGNIIEGILRLIMQENGNGSLKWPLDYIEKNVNVVDLKCPYVASIENAIKKIYRTEFGKRSPSLIRLMRHLRNLCRRVVGSFVIFLKEEMREAERRRDQDQVSYLREMEGDLKNLFI
ncbi:UNVERIFIED_CONTAM: hypothetical protein PYX00_004566 [Menopon gallinae]|uniref:Protein MMS22-like n=1 Tax=Menopon gallinae TaxID=328185 RepID=A0AAW2I670_9NEOP